MKNYQIEAKDGKKYWISRSTAVVGTIFSINRQDDTCYVLALKRGTGSETFPGLWCMPCGFIDFDETILEAASREIKEETNLDINPEYLAINSIDDDPKSFGQTITFRVFGYVTYRGHISVGTEGEKDEVAEVKWINVKDIDQYEWAFNHDKLIKKYI